MVLFRLALRNILGAGLRTWLSVFILSISYVIIIWHKGLLDGWDRQALNDMIKWEIAGGQFWNSNYDPYDPLSLENAYDPVPEQISSIVDRGLATPLLFVQGTIYPKGRLKSIIIKGIDPEQEIVAIPSGMLKANAGITPAIIGRNMAAGSDLKEGDLVFIRWRNSNGAFDASQVQIVGIFNTNVPTVDGSQIWIPLEELRKMLLAEGEATMVVCSETGSVYEGIENWNFKSSDDLLSDLHKIIKSKTMAGMVIWVILLMVAMLAIFDTQVLSIFRRQQEIGTYIAMGMTRGEVVGLFTLEGAMHAILATFVGALYGIPILYMQATRGITLPVSSSDYGLTMAEKLFPVYSLGLVSGTIIVVLLVTTAVSYWPSRRIAKMKPTDALKGRAQ
ncbi:MAG: FtsX-like permease family protein [Marinilabiliaceae bacterium]|jgi:ABC-type lipoprotein release transport system permease subunit|nr:FtsX-like permease family protein [Marinilabiliaceae bacterium]